MNKVIIKKIAARWKCVWPKTYQLNLNHAERFPIEQLTVRFASLASVIGWETWLHFLTNENQIQTRPWAARSHFPATGAGYTCSLRCLRLFSSTKVIHKLRSWFCGKNMPFVHWWRSKTNINLTDTYCQKELKIICIAWHFVFLSSEIYFKRLV